LLNLRQNQERQVKNKLAIEQRDLVELQQKKQNNLQRIQDNARYLGSDLKNLDARYLQIFDTFSQGIKTQNGQIEKKIVQQQEKVDSVKNELSEVAVKRKVIEKLKEKRSQEHYHEMRKLEDNEIDETNMQLANRN
jgi:flagellar export protein FliJ